MAAIDIKGKIGVYQNSRKNIKYCPREKLSDIPVTINKLSRIPGNCHIIATASALSLVSDAIDPASLNIIIRNSKANKISRPGK